MAGRLLEQRDGLAPDEDADYWFEEIEAVLPHCRTLLQMVSLHRNLDAAVRALAKQEQQTARPAVLTGEARLALTVAADFLKAAKAAPITT
ncbi:hypothetical protein [Streptomyces sp. NPDC056160]|uniref:hypothetical protein n=1 Tax=Streptomyces sp. NPDC056160 TaxID=3345731 RepID=UPI0035D68C33